MALARCHLVVTDEAGNLINGATITVERETGGFPLATPFSDRDGTIGLGNPFVAADGADAGFYVVGGVYRITATQGAFTRVWRHVAVGTAQELDYPIAAENISYTDANSPADITTVEQALDRLFDQSSVIYTPNALTRAAIQAAIDAAEAAGGGEVRLADADYISDGTTITIDGDDVRLVGSPNTRILASPDATSYNVVQVLGAAPGTDTTLATTVAIGAVDLVLTSAANIEVGDHAIIFCEQLTTGYFFNHISRCTAKVSNTITIADPMPFPLSSSDTQRSVRKFNHLKNVQVENIRFNGNGNSGAATRGLIAQRMVSCKFNGLDFEDFNNASGFYFSGGYHCSSDDIELRDCGNVNEADFTIRAQTKLQSGRVRSFQPSGFGPETQFCTNSTFESIICADANERGIKLQGTRFCQFGELQGNNSDSTGIAITLGSCDNQIGMAIALSNRGGSGNDVGIWFSGQHNCRNTILSAFCKNNQTADIDLNTNDDDNRILQAVYDTKQDDGIRNMVGSVNSNSFVVGGQALAVNANAVGDTAITIQSPTPEYRISTVVIQNVGTTASLTTAQFGIFTATGGGGTAISAAGQALTALTSNALNANAAVLNHIPATTPSAMWNLATMYFRITTAQGAAATINVWVVIQPCPQ